MGKPHYTFAGANVRRRTEWAMLVDWSIDFRKRWGAIAVLQNGVYTFQAPTPVGNLVTFFPRLLALAGPEGRVLTGFDFPIGLPQLYAQLAGIDGFLPMLSQFGRGQWADFYEVAATAAEIS